MPTKATAQRYEREAAAGSVPAPPPRLIRPSRGWAPLDLWEVWRNRELAFFMARRDVRLRYRQTLLGAAWAVLQPLAACAVFTIFLGRFAGIPSDGLPYPVFALAGLIPWQLFAYALLQASNSLVDNRAILSKIYFPRIIIPFAAVGAGIVDFVVSFALLLAAMWWYGVGVGPRVAAVPLLVLLAGAAALGVGVWLATLNVRYRDVRYAVPFLTQLWLFATPVAYPASLVPERWRPLLGLNPMAGVVEGFRWALLGRGEPASLVAVSTAVSAALLVSGLYYFRRLEREFADVI